jgi:hypothetical protein
MIHNVLGEDAKIFSPDEEPQPSELYKRLTALPDEEEEESFYTKVWKEFDKIQTEHKEILENVKELPSRIKVSKVGIENELMVFIKKRKDLFVGYHQYNNKTAKTVTFEEVFEKIKATPEDEGLPLSDQFWKSYHQIIEKSSFERHIIRTSSKDLFEASNRTLKSILNLSFEELKPYYSFISDLLEDIREYHTLSEYILKEIADLEGFVKKIEESKYAEDKKFLEEALNLLIKKLEKIKDEVGEDFLAKVERFLKDEPEEIIIAIENQKI